MFSYLYCSSRRTLNVCRVSIFLFYNKSQTPHGFCFYLFYVFLPIYQLYENFQNDKYANLGQKKYTNYFQCQ